MKLDNILNQLRKQHPDLHNAQLLTSSIMKQVAQKNRHSKPTFLIWMRTISSAAAMFLLGLLTFQQFETEADANNYHSFKIEHKISFHSKCILESKNKHTNLIEIYSSYLRQNSIKNKKFQSFSQQLNKSDHENNN